MRLLHKRGERSGIRTNECCYPYRFSIAAQSTTLTSFRREVYHISCSVTSVCVVHLGEYLMLSVLARSRRAFTRRSRAGMCGPGAKRLVHTLNSLRRAQQAFAGDGVL